MERALTILHFAYCPAFVRLKEAGVCIGGKVSGSFPELCHDVLNDDEPPGFATEHARAPSAKFKICRVNGAPARVVRAGVSASCW